MGNDSADSDPKPDSGDPVKVLVIGESGVGKSTLGNSFIGGRKNRFVTSATPGSCTQDVSYRTTEDGLYQFTDVPGIPDTNPKNTMDFYDIIVNEARQRQTVILFVFSCSEARITPAKKKMYENAALLFREINTKCLVTKILLLNDHRSHRLEDHPEWQDMTLEEQQERSETYHKQLTESYHNNIKDIEEATGIEFTFKRHTKLSNMKQDMNKLRKEVSKMKSSDAKDLRTFVQMSDYIEQLQKDKNYEEVLIKEKKKAIATLERQLTEIQITLAGLSAATFAATGFSLITFGATLGVATATVTASLAAAAALEAKKAELRIQKDSISEENLKKSVDQLKKAVIEFDKLKKAAYCS